VGSGVLSHLTQHVLCHGGQEHAEDGLVLCVPVKAVRVEHFGPVVTGALGDKL
jgi:hypothetical protein